MKKNKEEETCQRYDYRRTCEFNHRRMYNNMIYILNREEIPELECEMATIMWLKTEATRHGWLCFVCQDGYLGCRNCAVDWDGYGGGCHADGSPYYGLLMALRRRDKKQAIHYARLVRDMPWQRKSKKAPHLPGCQPKEKYLKAK